MFNLKSPVRLAVLFFCGLQAVTCIPLVESTQCEVDSHALMNDNNVANQIDRLLDVGFKFQEVNGKKFKISKALKKGYKVLEENGTHVPKEVKKDIERRIQKRIEDRYYAGVAKSATPSTREVYDDPRDKDFYGYEDSFRSSVIETCIGVAMCATPCPVAQAVGASVMYHGLCRVYEEAYKWYNREPSKRDRRENASNGRQRCEREKDMCRNDSRH